MANLGAAFAEARLGEAAHSSMAWHVLLLCSRYVLVPLLCRFGFEPSEKGLKEMMRAVQADSGLAYDQVFQLVL